MKKNIIILLIAIATNTYLNAMEPETLPCFFNGIPADIMNLIASFLTFNDVETEEEFINREKTISQYAVGRLVQKEKDKRIEQPNNRICAMTYGNHFLGMDLGDLSNEFPHKTYHLSILDTITNKELHNICLKNDVVKEEYEHLAVSSCGNIFAICYGLNSLYGPSTKIINLHTHSKEYPDYALAAVWIGNKIAFNKQGTHLIMHSTQYDHTLQTCIPDRTKIIPLTTTLANNTPPQKTLSRYFAQKMICKKISNQL